MTWGVRGHPGSLMNRLTLAGLLVLPVPAFAQGPANPPGTPEDNKKRLVQIEQEIGQANFTCDYRYFAQVEADEFIFTDATGGTTSKAQDLAGEKDCRKSDAAYALDGVRVSVYGTAAVVTARATITGKNKAGETTSRRSRFTDVFVWRAGRWQLVAGHSSRIPEEKKP